MAFRVEHEYLDSFRVLFFEYSKYLRVGLGFDDVLGA